MRSVQLYRLQQRGGTQVDRLTPWRALDTIDILQDPPLQHSAGYLSPGVYEFCIFKLGCCSTATDEGRSTQQAPAWCFVRKCAALQAFKEIGGPNTGLTPSDVPITLARPPALLFADGPVCVS